MTKLTIVEPSIGEKNTLADPKLITAYKEIEKVINGELEGTNNLKAEGVKESNLEKALQEKLVTNIGLTYAASAVSLEGVSSKFYNMTVSGTTLTLPAPTASRLIGVLSRGATGCKVTASAGKIYGDFTNGATTVELAENQHLLVLATGEHWLIIAGEPKRTATYSALTERVAGEYEPSATRDTQVNGYFHLPAVSHAQIEVGGVAIGEALNNGASIQKSLFSFRCPAGVKYKVSGEGATVYTSYLTL